MALHLRFFQFAGQLPELDMTILMYVILGSATGIKILLFIYCYALKNQSGVSDPLTCIGLCREKVFSRMRNIVDHPL